MNTLSSLLKFIGNKIAIMYPVGCYYWTSASPDTFNPSTVFGGTWELMDEGMVLVSAGTTYPITAGVHKDGGSKDAVVVSHTHSQAAHNHWTALYIVADRFGEGGRDAAGGYAGHGNPVYTDGQAPAIYASGVDGTGKNMPPYKNAYCWHRVA